MMRTVSTMVLACGAVLAVALVSPLWPTLKATAQGFGNIQMPDNFRPQLQTIQVMQAGEAEIVGEAPAYVIQKKYTADGNLPVAKTAAQPSPLGTEPKPLLPVKKETDAKKLAPTFAQKVAIKKKPVVPKPSATKPEKMSVTFKANQTVSTAQQNAMTKFVEIIAKRNPQNRQHLFMTTHAPTKALEATAQTVAKPVADALKKRKLLTGTNPIAVHELIFTQGTQGQGKMGVLVK